MVDHLAISGGLSQAPLNPLKTDVSRGLPILSGRRGPLGPHRNSATADRVSACHVRPNFGISGDLLSKNEAKPVVI